jgi:hypothetical protein
VGGAGVALVGAGVFFGMRASSIKSDIQKEMTYSASKDSDYHSAGTMAVVTLVGGALAVAGGAVLYVIGSNQATTEGAAPASNAPPPTTPMARLVPAVGPGGAGLLLSGRF